MPVIVSLENFFSRWPSAVVVCRLSVSPSCFSDLCVSMLKDMIALYEDEALARLWSRRWKSFRRMVSNEYICARVKQDSLLRAQDRVHVWLGDRQRYFSVANLVSGTNQYRLWQVGQTVQLQSTYIEQTPRTSTQRSQTTVTATQVHCRRTHFPITLFCPRCGEAFAFACHYHYPGMYQVSTLPQRCSGTTQSYAHNRLQHTQPLEPSPKFRRSRACMSVCPYLRLALRHLVHLNAISSSKDCTVLYKV